MLYLALHIASYNRFLVAQFDHLHNDFTSLVIRWCNETVSNATGQEFFTAFG